jgi:hypothetical protein
LYVILDPNPRVVALQTETILMKRITIEGVAFECTASVIKEKKEHFLKLTATSLKNPD